MNRYIDHLTINEYKVIQRQLTERLNTLKQEMEQTEEKKEYIETRFILIKIKNILQKYEKDLTKNQKTDTIKLMKGK